MSYLALRHLHISCVVISISLLVLRSGLLMMQRPVPRALKWVPHANDSVLLLAAIGLAVSTGQLPLQQGWLTAKLSALLLYILLGREALRPNLAPRRRLLWLGAALACVGYIVSVAVTRQVWPF